MEVAEVVENAENTRIQDWETAVTLLSRLLDECDGCVSTLLLRRELQRKGVTSAKALTRELRFFDFEGSDGVLPIPGLRWRHKKRSFYTESAYQAEEQRTEAAAKSAEVVEVAEVPVQPEPSNDSCERRRNRREEARLVTYVRDQLESLYATDDGPELPFVFDVHNQRAGAGYENVDLVAVHWRSSEIVDLVTVEVKLAFTSALLQQAANYRRFSNRVWIAVPVRAQLHEASGELRETDPLLFEAVVAMGVGILACRRTRGSCYDVVPVHWPNLIQPDAVERAFFIERYRDSFEEAGVIAPQKHGAYPVLA